MNLRNLLTHLGMGLQGYLEHEKQRAIDAARRAEEAEANSVEARLERLERWREHNASVESKSGRPCACELCNGWVSFRYEKDEDGEYRYHDDGDELCSRCVERGCEVPRA